MLMNRTFPVMKLTSYNLHYENTSIFSIFTPEKVPTMHFISKTIFSLALVLGIASCAPKQAFVTLDTSEGEIVLSLYDDTPLHKANFINKVTSGIYDGRTFNRVIEGFVVQCGEEQEEDIIPAEIIYPKYYHKRGALAMGRCTSDETHELKSADEQFYICWGRQNDSTRMERAKKLMDQWSYGRVSMDPEIEEYYKTNPGQPSLDGSYTIFGEVVEGLDIVENIQKTETDSSDRPLKDITILKATVQYKRVK